MSSAYLHTQSGSQQGSIAASRVQKAAIQTGFVWQAMGLTTTDMYGRSLLSL